MRLTTLRGPGCLTWRPAGWRAVTSPAARQPWRASPKFPIRVARVTWSAPRIFGFHYETGMSRLFRTYRAPLSQCAISERKFPTGTGIVGARKIHHLGALASCKEQQRGLWNVTYLNERGSECLPKSSGHKFYHCGQALLRFLQFIFSLGTFGRRLSLAYLFAFRARLDTERDGY